MSGPEIQVQWDPIAPTTPWSVPLFTDPKACIGAASLDDVRRATRLDLGLDPDRPVVVVGHQPVLWHPGILAKFIAGDVLARRHDAQLVHLVIDAHRGPFGSVDWPEGNDPESFHEAQWRCMEFDADMPMCRQPARPPADAPGAHAQAEVLEGLQQCHDALAAAQDQASAADQFASALDRLMDPWVGPRTTVTASRLMETGIGHSLLNEMKRDSNQCAAACNMAIGRDPTLGIHRLGDHGHGLELPLWIERSGSLETGVEADLDAKGATFHPKALLVTALARLGLGDLFIHGLGGWRYDQAMEDWMKAWLGLVPPPRAMVTATMHLPLLDPEWIRAAQTELVQEVRRRRHDPEATSHLHGPGPTKSRSLAEIEELPRGSSQRRDAFQRMHGWIDQQVTADDGGHQQCAARLDELASLQSRRTWAFPMHPASELEALREGVVVATT